MQKSVLPLLLAIFMLGGILEQTEAQSTRGNYNFLDFQQKPYYFGITLGYNRSDYRPFRSEEFLASQNIQSVEAVPGPGFNLAIVTNLKLGRHFDLRLLPGLSFAERQLVYSGEATTPSRNVSSIFAEVPFHVRYKSAPYKDMRLFMVAGVKYAFDVASDSDARQSDDRVKISPTDFSAEIGAGVQFFFPYFIFSPEFKVSHGIGNVLIYDNDLPSATVLEKVLSRTFTLSFHFEG
ncbi:MAG: porin family protein [Bacteroidota bacterium]